ncbi:MAG: hypothetical protein EBY80_10490 [Actinobacteria bacterium]|jgi:hypothetical protein|nr:hypothetical protein [Actinomycetota bacterium]NDA79036.1 hypothetical protein [Actinomycetota bacterium]
MRYIKPFNESMGNLTQEQIRFLEDCTDGTWKVNPDTGLIDVQGNFNCDNKNLDDFKGLRFGKVSGGFYCSDNNLKTLDGSPREVGGSFWCERNPLISLEAAPLKVGYYFWFNNISIYYNLASFLVRIKEDRPGVTELLLTHHFLTPGVIKEEIAKDSYFCYYVSRAWNTEGFKKKQDELIQILTEEDLQKIDALWSIGGYL